MKKVLFLSMLLLVCPGCLVRPWHVPVLVEIGNSETAFMIALSGKSEQASLQSEEFLKQNMVATKRIEIPFEWKDESRWPNVGKWIPSARLLIVDRSPETRLWTADKNVGTSNRDEALWVESSDSVGFSVGINITARIANEQDAVKFLYNYPARIDGRRSQENSAQSAENTYQVAVSSLSNIMDMEIKAKIQEAMADAAAKYKMDQLREMKTEILGEIREVVIPFFSERGITITAIGMFGGFHYENPQIQQAIDEVFRSQQDRQVALAETAAAKERRESLKQKGEGQAEQTIATARGEAQAIQMVADAKAYELEKLSENPEAYLALKRLEIEMRMMERWNGIYPQYLMQTGSDSPGLLLTLPVPKD